MPSIPPLGGEDPGGDAGAVPGQGVRPACGSGGMFVESEKFVEAHGGKRSDISVYGREYTDTTWKLAKMNAALRGIEADLGERSANSFTQDLHPDLRADFVLANPPFRKMSVCCGSVCCCGTTRGRDRLATVLGRAA